MHPISAMSGTARVVALVGAGVGLLVFLLSGLLPSIVYGSFAGMAVAQSLMGEVGGTITGTALEVTGAVLVSLGVGGLFIVIGAVVGAALHVLARVLAR